MDEAHRTHPNAWWWVKADGCDLVSGVCESTKLEWSGDVDLNDGDLQKLYEVYRRRLAFIVGVGVGDRVTPALIVDDLSTCSHQLAEYMLFISKGTKPLCVC